MIICQDKLTKLDIGMSYSRHKGSEDSGSLTSVNIVIYCIEITFFSDERPACNKWIASVIPRGPEASLR